MAEIKLGYEEVNYQLSEIKNAVQSLQVHAEPPILENQLDVAAKLAELTRRLEQLLRKYQSVLLKNLQSTGDAVESLRELDEKISHSIRSSKPGPARLIE
ncbi:YwqI/YxiC family protein [Bacillaceae bacterium Marseille-Q3522]|nr:YwqI/YxiC family protein [Bacillaceae bacterium Marseille-Q3522]